MSEILKRIIAAQQSDDSPFVKDSEGRILELTTTQGEVFTGYYQADDGTYYTQQDWLEHQRQLELQRIAEEEYEAQQAALAQERAQRERKKEQLAAQQKKKVKNISNIPRARTMLVAIMVLSGIVVLSFIFWPDTIKTDQDTKPEVSTNDVVTQQPLDTIFGNAIITGIDVRMRAQPNLQGKIITYFPKENERVLVVQAVNDTLDWARVRRENGIEGWVFGEYVKAME
ncbi:SH3 domain-containing protein [Marinirhabdus gelatinilytica]|uniref:SH3 domain-containing protein n=1 Tax=Marinirhabdus gelatinilytica TaxID=1703343 RepID=A0A370QAQ3_9FLAO|nr:SH3 domain-containing protein [Marinirhabdus gelatinilytica]RDK85458.1 SH3 domain-containing protein [Marinirhabdus gelatinilytica]